MEVAGPLGDATLTPAAQAFRCCTIPGSEVRGAAHACHVSVNADALTDQQIAEYQASIGRPARSRRDA